MRSPWPAYSEEMKKTRVEGTITNGDGDVVEPNRHAGRPLVVSGGALHRPEFGTCSSISLPKPERAIVSKLSAILRVAEALDASHQQKCRDFTLSARRRCDYALGPGNRGRHFA